MGQFCGDKIYCIQFALHCYANKNLRILEFYTLSGFLLNNRKFSLKLCINFKLESVVKFSKDESI